MNPLWAAVMVGGLFETGWSATMKLSHGFSDPLWTVATLVLMGISIVLLNKGLKGGLPVGPCYAVWVGIGAVGSVIMGIFAFDEVPNALGFVNLALIIVGVLGLNLVTGTGDGEDSHR